MRLNLALTNTFVIAACVTIMTTPLLVGASVNPSQEERYFHQVALKWGQMANKPIESDSPAVLKAGISTYVSRYRLDTGDVVTINIPDLELTDLNSKEQMYKTSAYQNDYQVDRDGMVTIPSFGTFSVAGLSTEQTAKMLEEMASVRRFEADASVFHLCSR
jgi:Polysaccharide biosynthesis/export protein